jgi:hypothetical protein
MLTVMISRDRGLQAGADQADPGEELADGLA